MYRSNFEERGWSTAQFMNYGAGGGGRFFPLKGNTSQVNIINLTFRYLYEN